MDKAYSILLTAGALLLAVMILFCLIRAIKGPRITDRIVSINMIGTMTIMIIAILAVYKGENYLVDVCLIYAMISFLAVIVLTKVYMGVHKEQEAGKEAEEDAETNILTAAAGKKNAQAKKRGNGKTAKTGKSGKENEKTDAGGIAKESVRKTGKVREE